MSDIVPIDQKIDALELAMLSCPDALIDMPLVHRFVPGAYVREIFIPAGTLTTSKIHKTEHVYIVLTGKVSVFIDGVGVQHITAPYVGVTKPGTRRVLYIHEDCRWITFHPTPDNETDLEVLENRLIERRELPDGSTANEHYKRLLAEQDELHLLAALEPQEDYGGAP